MPSAENRFPETLRTPRLSFFGMLCGHIWIWDVCHRAAANHPAGSPTIDLYIAMSVFLIAVTLAARLAPRSSRPPRWVDWPAAALMAGATLVLSYPMPVALPDALVVAAAIVGGAGIGWTYLQWAFFYARLDARNTVACIFGAMALGSLLKIGVDLAPAAAASIVCALLPFASALLYRDAEAHAPSNDNRTTQAQTGGAPLRSLAKILLGVAAFGLVTGIMQGIRIEADPAPRWALSSVHHLLETASALAVVWLVLIRRHGLPFCNLWRLVLVFTATGCLALPLFGSRFSGWALVAVAVAQTLVVMLLWAMLADVAHRSPVNPLAVFGLGWTAYSLPFPLGHALGGVVDYGSMGSPLITIVVYLVSMASVFLLDERDFSRNRVFADLEGPVPPSSMSSTVERTCRELASARDLTGREAEVMKLIVLGRSKGYIAEALCISENTVRSHARHLYAKLGVHSKQELLDMVLANLRTEEARLGA